MFKLFFTDKIYTKIGREEAEKSLRMFDQDKDGKLKVDEFKHVMKTLANYMTPVEIDEFIKLADPADDGYIMIKEFLDVLVKE